MNDDKKQTLVTWAEGVVFLRTDAKKLALTTKEATDLVRALTHAIGFAMGAREEES